MPSKNLIRIDLYLDKEEYIDVAQWAQKANIRHGGVKLFKDKKNHPGTLIPNTKGLAKFFKYCFTVYKGTNAEKVLQIASALEEKNKAEQRLKALGAV